MLMHLDEGGVLRHCCGKSSRANQVAIGFDLSPPFDFGAATDQDAGCAKAKH
jgi:hypothetical protein